MVDISLGRLITRRAELTPHRRALTFEGRSLDYRQLATRVERLAAAFSAGGVRRCDRVGYIGRNHPALLESLLATALLGGSFVPLNFRLAGPELRYIIADAGLHTLIADDEARPLIDSSRTELRLRRTIGSESGAPGWDSLEDLIAWHEPMRETLAVDSDDVALIMYTSGTTGLPKGAMLTHANVWWNNVNILTFVDLTADEVTLVVAPLFHIGGLNVNTIATWLKGGEIVLQRNFDPAAVLESIAEHRVTQMFGVPGMFAAIARDPSFARADLSSLRFFIVGGAPVPESLIEIYLARGIAFTQGYGLTETSPVVTFLPPRYLRSKVGSAGHTPIYTEVEIRDDAGRTVPRGQRGEIHVRGPNVMKGYWRKPEETAEVIDEQRWLHTGDVGWVDEDGFLYVVDRIKDLVISGGENVYPAEVERVLQRHPRIAEIAVIGLPDERWGEAVTAVAVVSGEQRLTLEELRAFAAPELANFKLPNRLECLPALPRNAAGKILKVELRRRFSSSSSG
jgi:fatty-acyl-CoA synthase